MYLVKKRHHLHSYMDSASSLLCLRWSA